MSPSGPASPSLARVHRPAYVPKAHALLHSANMRISLIETQIQVIVGLRQEDSCREGFARPLPRPGRHPMQVPLQGEGFIFPHGSRLTGATLQECTWLGNLLHGVRMASKILHAVLRLHPLSASLHLTGYVSHNQSKELSPASVIASGGLAGVAFWSSCYPADLVMPSQLHLEIRHAQLTISSSLRTR